MHTIDEQLDLALARNDALEQELKAALAENATLKAEAKTAEQRAAEIYGAQASTPAHLTNRGETHSTLKERFLAADTPEKQGAFLRSLDATQKAELFQNN